MKDFYYSIYVYEHLKHLKQNTTKTKRLMKYFYHSIYVHSYRNILYKCKNCINTSIRTLLMLKILVCILNTANMREENFKH